MRLKNLKDFLFNLEFIQGLNVFGGFGEAGSGNGTREKLGFRGKRGDSDNLR